MKLNYGGKRHINKTTLMGNVVLFIFLPYAATTNGKEYNMTKEELIIETPKENASTEPSNLVSELLKAIQILNKLEIVIKNTSNLALLQTITKTAIKPSWKRIQVLQVLEQLEKAIEKTSYPATEPHTTSLKKLEVPRINITKPGTIKERPRDDLLSNEESILHQLLLNRLKEGLEKPSSKSPQLTVATEGTPTETMKENAFANQKSVVLQLVLNQFKKLLEKTSYTVSETAMEKEETTKESSKENIALKSPNVKSKLLDILNQQRKTVGNPSIPAFNLLQLIPYLLDNASVKLSNPETEPEHKTAESVSTINNDESINNKKISNRRGMTQVEMAILKQAIIKSFEEALKKFEAEPPESPKSPASSEPPGPPQVPGPPQAPGCAPVMPIMYPFYRMYYYYPCSSSYFYFYG
ncbi:uncharacterized protein LOC125242307 [Leguminivora glycinivorella]|uniref:uncharacterized protein LOC125242307 n=1 Tax=Leguminivora glycinivorella TaxID=1035111 RepID=UPI00200EF729|nr:uncharacterized protein LOC125242307 [Leguminivora glycinivorella]